MIRAGWLSGVYQHWFNGRRQSETIRLKLKQRVLASVVVPESEGNSVCTQFAPAPASQLESIAHIGHLNLEPNLPSESHFQLAFLVRLGLHAVVFQMIEMVIDRQERYGPHSRTVRISVGQLHSQQQQHDGSGG